MSAVPAATIIPPGQHAPFATVTDDDHRAWIIVSAAMGVSFTLLTLLVRVLSRLYVNRGWALDDTFAVMSTVSQSKCAHIQYCWSHTDVA